MDRAGYGNPEKYDAGTSPPSHHRRQSDRFAPYSRNHDRFSRSSFGSSNPYGSSNRGGNNYRGDFRGRGRGGNRRGRGGPGSGRARDDDSQTEAKSSKRGQIIPFNDIQGINVPLKIGDMKVNSNGYLITADKGKNVFLYEIRWNGIPKETPVRSKKITTFNMNSQTKAGQYLRLKQTALIGLFEQLLRDQKEFFDFDEDLSQFVYDSGNQFYAHKKLLEKGGSHKIVLDVAQFPQSAKDYYKDIAGAEVIISLKLEIKTDSLCGLLDVDRPVIQYLELAFSQEQRKSDQFYVFDNEFFEKDSRISVLEGSGRKTPFILKSGVVKSMVSIGDPGDKKLMINLVPKKTVFYGCSSLKELIEYSIHDRMQNVWKKWEEAHKAVRNLTVCTTHMEYNKFFVVSGLSEKSARGHTFKLREGEETTVADYFSNYYDRTLENPDLPCIIEAGRNYYPLDVLKIADVQRVPKFKRDKKLDSMTTKECTFTPHENVIAIEDQRDKASIYNSNDYIKNTGCRVIPKLLSVTAKQFFPPSIVLADTHKTVNSGVFGMKTGDKFYLPASIKKLAIVTACFTVGQPEVEEFSHQLMQRLKLYGIKIASYEFFSWDSRGKDCDRLFDLEANQFDYVLIIGDEDELHHGMKSMELKTKLVTQHVMSRTLNKVDYTLLDNLAFKLNLRAGGINWKLESDPRLVEKLKNVDLLKSLCQNTLFFGVDMVKPDGDYPEPACIGFSSNLYSGESIMLKGDFGYQSPKETIIDSSLLKDRFCSAIKGYYLKNGKYPSWILVYRAGLCDGDLQKVQQKEVQDLKAVISDFNQTNQEFEKAGSKLTVVMSNTHSNYRLFKEEINSRDSVADQNLPPGTCVSSDIVPLHSFLLISQRPTKGTVHPTLYNVLEGWDAVPFEHIQWLTYCLCYSRGSNTSPTSLPGPLESASDLSKRAKNNFKQWKILQYSAGENAINDLSSCSDDKTSKKRFDSGEYYAKLNNDLRASIVGDCFWS